MEPILTVLTYSAIAAAAATLGVVPLAIRAEPPRSAIGWSNAIAAGAMLGAAYVLMEAGLGLHVLHAGVGAVIGTAFVWLTHLASRTEELDLNRLDETEEAYVYQVLLIDTLHAGSEGVAIGAAMAVDVTFGIFVALALAFHNIPEATVLGAVLRARGVSLAGAAGLATTTNVTQVLMAVVTFAIVAALPSMLSWAIGFAFGSLVSLVVAELLSESYRQAGHTTVAIVALLSMGIVVLLGGVAG